MLPFPRSQGHIIIQMERSVVRSRAQSRVGVRTLRAPTALTPPAQSLGLLPTLPMSHLGCENFKGWRPHLPFGPPALLPACPHGEKCFPGSSPKLSWFILRSLPVILLPCTTVKTSVCRFHHLLIGCKGQRVPSLMGALGSPNCGVPLRSLVCVLGG